MLSKAPASEGGRYIVLPIWMWGYWGLAVMARKTLSSTAMEWVKTVAAFAPGIAT